ncbi:hypothetical protein BKA64DRAFT_673610 [Cadophora sp. MPI-SDFR-AT-0126]|nr:hypothetical protein BKA64DRAFT_673610 [Leotiomycetes sp. MPI-SDFR-AT-0126]
MVSIITTLGCFIIICLVLGYFLPLDESPSKSKPEKPTGPPSTNRALNFVEEYPDVDPKRASVECLKAWYGLIVVSCHTAIWTTNSEFSLSQLHGRSIDEFFGLTCAANCTEALVAAHNSISSACAGQDVFTLNGYEGPFNTTLLEKTPAAAVDELKERQSYICQKTPIGNDTQRFCVVDLQSRWAIIDKIRSDGLSGLARFLIATKMNYKEPAVQYPGQRGSGDRSEDHSYYREERRYGPGRHSTTCSWCTLKWFEEKLGMWQEGMSMAQEQLSLPQFLRIWEAAGRRCEGNGFYEIYNAAIDSYKKQGLLREGWEKQLLGDIPYLIRHGPSQGDFPTPQTEEAISILKNYYEKHTAVPTTEARQHDLEVIDEYISCLEWFKAAIQDLPCYPFLSVPEIETYLLCSASTTTTACSWECSGALGFLQRQMYDACPAMRRGHWEKYDTIVPHSLETDLEFSLQPFFAKGGTIDLWNSACRRSVRSVGDTPCTAIFKQWDAEDWVLQKPSPEILFRTTREQLALLSEMPPKLRDWKPVTFSEMTEEDRVIFKEYADWTMKMLEGVCSTCVWEMYVPGVIGFDTQIKEFEGLDQETAMEWIRSVHEIKTECEKHGASAHYFQVTDVDEAWIRTFSQDLYDKAFKESKEDAEAPAGDKN